MKMNSILLATALSALMVTGASAATGDALQAKLGYANNNVVGKDVLLAEVGVATTNDVRAGFTFQVDTKREDLVTYGTYLAKGLPAAYNVTVVPAIGLEQYNKENALTGFAQVGLEAPLAESVDVSVAARYTEAFQSKKDLDGMTYMFGLSKTF